MTKTSTFSVSVRALDPDKKEVLTYSFVDPATQQATQTLTFGDVAFAINNTTGEITFTGTLIYEVDDSYSLDVLVTDKYGASGSGNITINVENALSAADITNPTTQFFHNGHIYEVITTNVTWEEARAAAANKSIDGFQGYLVTVTSAEEQAFINSIIDSIDSHAGYWFGASDATAEGDWRWVNGPEVGTQFWSGDGGGSPVGGAYSNWTTTGTPYPPEPNDGVGNEDYLYFNYLGNHQWWDGRGDETVSYIVEYGGVPSSEPDRQSNLAGTSRSPIRFICNQRNAVVAARLDRHSLGTLFLL